MKFEDPDVFEAAEREFEDGEDHADDREAWLREVADAYEIDVEALRRFIDSPTDRQ